jgi:hypothetical protein
MAATATTESKETKAKATPEELGAVIGKKVAASVAPEFERLMKELKSEFKNMHEVNRALSEQLNTLQADMASMSTAIDRMEMEKKPSGAKKSGGSSKSTEAKTPQNAMLYFKREYSTNQAVRDEFEGRREAEPGIDEILNRTFTGTEEEKNKKIAAELWKCFSKEAKAEWQNNFKEFKTRDAAGAGSLETEPAEDGNGTEEPTEEASEPAAEEAVEEPPAKPAPAKSTPTKAPAKAAAKTPAKATPAKASPAKTPAKK